MLGSTSRDPELLVQERATIFLLNHQILIDSPDYKFQETAEISLSCSIWAIGQQRK